VPQLFLYPKAMNKNGCGFLWTHNEGEGKMLIKFIAQENNHNTHRHPEERQNYEIMITRPQNSLVMIFS
jgi:hypothetical protein